MRSYAEFDFVTVEHPNLVPLEMGIYLYLGLCDVVEKSEP